MEIIIFINIDCHSQEIYILVEVDMSIDIIEPQIRGLSRYILPSYSKHLHATLFINIF